MPGVLGIPQLNDLAPRCNGIWNSISTVCRPGFSIAVWPSLSAAATPSTFSPLTIASVNGSGTAIHGSLKVVSSMMPRKVAESSASTPSYRAVFRRYVAFAPGVSGPRRVRLAASHSSTNRS